MNDDLLRDICCPATRQSLRLAESSVVDRVNAGIAADGLKNHGGTLVEDRIDAALMREDGEVIYPVRGSTPVLLVAEAISIRDL